MKVAIYLLTRLDIEHKLLNEFLFISFGYRRKLSVQTGADLLFLGFKFLFFVN